MPEDYAASYDAPRAPDSRPSARSGSGPDSSARSLRDLYEVLRRRRRFVGAVVGGLLLLCLLYCLIAPNQYEAEASVALRQTPASALNLEGPDALASASILSAPLQQETLANVFRSDPLAWKTILALKLYQQPGFMGSFSRRFPAFQPDAPLGDTASAAAQAYLLQRFRKRLRVETVPRTFLIQIRFRCRDAELSARVVNTLIQDYSQQNSEQRIQATNQAAAWMENQLKSLKTQIDQDQQRLADFQQQHGLLTTPATQPDGQLGQTQQTPVLEEIHQVSQQLAAATGDRILREAEYHAAQHGDPELVVASDPELAADGSDFATALLQQIHTRQSELEQEQTQLNIQDGPNFPRVVEIRRLLENLDQQKKIEDARLVARFGAAWQTAEDREQLLRVQLDELTREGMRANATAAQFATMSQKANASQQLYLQVLAKVEEANLSAGVEGSGISIIDPARPPVRPVAPDLPLDLAITFFVSFWLAIGGALLLESLHPTLPVRRTLSVLLAFAMCAAFAHAQAPTPSTSGLPTGVVTIPDIAPTPNLPNPKNAPAVWNSAGAAAPAEAGQPYSAAQSASPLPAPIAPGDLLDVSEFHTPEFHSVVRVSPQGTVDLPLIHAIKVAGLDEQSAARAIEAVLLAEGMLRHPQVSVLVVSYVGQDVSVLGEVVHPGVYPYTLHHRLLDLISAASGLTPNAGRLVNIYHRNDAKTPHSVVLDPSGTDGFADHNPELLPGDTVLISRAGLVYVVGDVLRPGGFPVDPAQGLTVVQALALAWGTTPNAASSRALLIREQKGGRTLTTLNLKKMLRGQEPDQPIRDHDILYVPDSTAKSLMNKTLESAIQSAIGVTIYSALVYSQRY